MTHDLAPHIELADATRNSPELLVGVCFLSQQLGASRRRAVCRYCTTVAAGQRTLNQLRRCRINRPTRLTLPDAPASSFVYKSDLLLRLTARAMPRSAYYVVDIRLIEARTSSIKQIYRPGVPSPNKQTNKLTHTHIYTAEMLTV